MSQGFHEDLSRKHEVKRSSDRSFGGVFTAVFAFIGLWPLVAGTGLRYWALGLAVAVGLVTLVRPSLLAPANRLWFKLGELLHRIVNPVVLSLTFVLAVIPTGIIMRACGKDPLRRKFEPDLPSYWLVREPAGPAPETMKDQF
jgi:hypothetical protein